MALDAIFTDPDLGPLARGVVPPGTPGAVNAGDDPALVRAFEEYQRAPNDQAAFVHLLRTASNLGRQEALQAVEAKDIERANQARTHARQLRIAETINGVLAEEAPDVDRELFWSFGRRAERETPRHLTDQSARIEWQKNRMVQYARAKMRAITEPAVRAALEAARVQSNANVVAPAGGGTPPPAQPQTPGRPRTSVETLREIRSRQVV